MQKQLTAIIERE